MITVLSYILILLISLGISIYFVILTKKTRDDYFRNEVIPIAVFAGSTMRADQKTTRNIKIDAVSAGSATKTVQTAEILIKGYKFSDASININNFILLLVCGSSMKKENIENGDAVMVEQRGVDELKRNNIILVKNDSEGEKIKHKLRKYITIVDDIDFLNFAQNNSLEVGIFQDCYESSKNKIEELKQQKKKIVISQTYIEEKNYKIHYSFHSDDLIEGVVKYAIPSKYVEVIKRNN